MRTRLAPAPVWAWMGVFGFATMTGASTEFPVVDAQQMPKDYPLGATLEYVNYPKMSNRIHAGIDVLVTPHLDDLGQQNLAADLAVVTSAGTVSQLIYDPATYDPNDPVELDDEIVIATAEGRVYAYAHVDTSTLRGRVVDAWNQRDLVLSAHEVIGNIVRWDQCGVPPGSGAPPPPSSVYSHLHYEIREGPADSQTIIAPPVDLATFKDVDPPTIGFVEFRPDDAALGDPIKTPTMWGPPFTPAWPGTCVRVWDQIDIVTEVEDRDRAGLPPSSGDATAVKQLRYRICPTSNPDCPDWRRGYDFSRMPAAWADHLRPETYAYYSIRDPDASRSEYCSDDRFVMVPTNMVDDTPDASGSWDTTAPWTSSCSSPSGSLCYPDGHYTVTVVAEDFAANTATREVPVCVTRRDGVCFGQLVSRDCLEDDGAEPSSCSDWWESPDITPNPFDPAGYGGIAPTKANDMQICMTNAGCAPIDPSTLINVELAWAYPSAYIPNPLGNAGAIAVTFPPTSASNLETRLGVSLASVQPPPPWQVGEERCIRSPWTPSLSLAFVTGGHFCLVSRVWTSSDPVNPSSASVQFDNNSAQHNYIIGDPALPTVDKAIDFVHPGRGLTHRSIGLSTDGLPADLRGMHFQVFVGPGVRFGSVRGGVEIGEMSDSEFMEWRGEAPFGARVGPETSPCGETSSSVEGPSSDRCWRVLDIACLDEGLTMEDLEVERTAPIAIYLWRDSDALGKSVDLTVREHGRREGSAGDTPLGGLRVHFNSRSRP